MKEPLIYKFLSQKDILIGGLIISMVFNKIKKYWHPVTIPMGLFTAWLWSFPMYGPLLTFVPGRINLLFLTFLLSHALGLLTYVFIIDYFYSKKKIKFKFELKLCLIFSSLIGFLTIFFPFLSSAFLIPVMVIIGFLSGPVIVFFLFYLSRVEENKRGRILGLIFFLAGIISIPFLLFPVAIWMYILNGIFLFSSFLLLNVTGEKDTGSFSLEFEKVKVSYWIGLILLIIMFYIGGGLMYSLSYNEIFSSLDSNFDFGFLFYMATALPVGFFADKRGRKYLINIGLSFSGLGFLLMLLFTGDLLNSFSLGLLQSGFAAMDLFVFLTLIDWTAHFKSRKLIGAGLFFNVIVIFISSWSFLGGYVGNLISHAYIPAIGLFFILLMIPLLNIIKETAPLQQKLNNLQNKKLYIKSWYDKYSLTPREREVTNLLLDGNSTSEIVETLSISHNTLKTHLKNIYRKTNTGGQTELILLIWKETEK